MNSGLQEDDSTFLQRVCFGDEATVYICCKVYCNYNFRKVLFLVFFKPTHFFVKRNKILIVINKPSQALQWQASKLCIRQTT